MRYGIVYMKKVQFFKANHIHQFACQGKFIRNIIKQGIFGDGNFVVKKIGRKEIKPGRL